MKKGKRQTKKSLLDRLSQLKNWQVALILLLLGGLVFSSGLSGGFQGDDFDQIVDNKAIHSLGNIGQFFGAGTFWNGEALTGDFYRPMMSLTFSAIYTFFGANPIAFHAVQLLLYIAGAFMVYLFLKRFTGPLPALLGTLILAIHPINTQVIYSIPCMQEPLFFLPGISALYILTRSQKPRLLLLAAALLFLSLLAKETAVVFVVLAVAYLFIYHRAAAWTFVKILITPVIFYLLIRYGAVGHTSLQHISPISDLGFIGRLLTIPSLIVFYFATFFWPKSLATNYYWTEPQFSLGGVLLPLFIVLFIVAIFTAGALYIKRYGTKQQFTHYLFFLGWLTVGLGPYMQLIQLDMTACETWFYAAQVGLVGALTILLSVLLENVRKRLLILLLILVVLIISALGARSFIRGFDYRSQTTISSADIVVDPTNYFALNNLARMEIRADNLKEARHYAERSIAAYPAVSNYNNLGVIAQKQKDLKEARIAYEASLQYGTSATTYANLVIIYSAVESSETTIQLIASALERYPNNTKLLTFLAIHQAALGQRSESIATVNRIYSLGGQIPSALVVALQQGTALDIPIVGTDTIIHIPAQK